jgi:hypothetical protein
MMDFGWLVGRLVVRFREDKRYKKEFKDAMEWGGLFFVLLILLWILK